MTSSNVVIEAPMSFTGSAKRIWGWSSNIIVRLMLSLPIIGLVWCVVACWYVVFGLWLVPYRLVRRSQRRKRGDDLRHSETLEALRAK